MRATNALYCGALNAGRAIFDVAHRANAPSSPSVRPLISHQAERRASIRKTKTAPLDLYFSYAPTVLYVCMCFCVMREAYARNGN